MLNLRSSEAWRLKNKRKKMKFLRMNLEMMKAYLHLCKISITIHKGLKATITRIAMVQQRQILQTMMQFRSNSYLEIKPRIWKLFQLNPPSNRISPTGLGREQDLIMGSNWQDRRDLDWMVLAQTIEIFQNLILPESKNEHNNK